MGKYIVIILISFGFLFAFGLFDSEMLPNLLSIFFGFVLSSLIMGLLNVVSSKFEDSLKVTENTESLVKLYKADDIGKTVEINGTSEMVAYKPLYVGDQTGFTICDDPEKRFEPGEFVINNYTLFFDAHLNSFKENSHTIRLDDFVEENGCYKLYMSRSNFYHHLTTNRAIDYWVEDDLTLRTYYDFGPRMVSLKDSQMSNHIGINALVFLKDGELLLPMRDGNSTISKNQITSSIAMRLNPADTTKKITEEYLFRGCIVEGLANRNKITADWLDEEDAKISFLGFGQNPYEGGKPQFYYVVHLPNIDRQTYITHIINTQKDKTKAIDMDKYTFVVKTDTMKFNKQGKLTFEYVHGSIKKDKYQEVVKTTAVSFEKSFLANYWHAQQLNKIP